MAKSTRSGILAGCLLLATSACPDDLSPTNGWNPTDILVRVYPPRNEEQQEILTTSLRPVLALGQCRAAPWGYPRC